MKKGDADFSHMMGWFVAAVIAACVLIEFSTNAVPGAARFADFVNKYQTLLTGFLAAGAAFVTVHFLQRQIDVAQTQARDTFTIALRRNRALARKAISAATDLSGWIVLDNSTPNDLATEDGWKLFLKNLRQFGELVNDGVFDAVEHELGYPRGYGANFVRGLYRDFTEERSGLLNLSRVSDEQVGAEFLEDWRLIARTATLYCNEIRSVCEGFIEESDIILARYQ